MPKIKNVVPIDTVLNEYVYTALYKASYEQKRNLKGKYLKAAMTERAAKSFAANSTKEDKEMLLSELGYEFYYVINPTTQANKIIQTVLPVLKTGKKSKISDVIAETGLFVTGDREIMRMLGIVSRVSHHPTFFINLELQRQGYHIKKWSKRYSSQADNDRREADESAKALAKILYNGALALDYSKGLLGCSPAEMKILLYLYSSSSVDPTDDEVKANFLGRMKGQEYNEAIRNLMYSQSIRRLSGNISITSVGIKKVSSFIDSSITKNSF